MARRPSGGGPAGAAVAPRVHGCRQPQRPFEGVLHDRNGDAAQRVEAAGGTAAELSGPADPLHAFDQLGGDTERDHHRHAELVEGAGQHPQGPLGIGQRVGRAQAAQQAPQPEAVVEGRDRALER